jgi:uncharacterized membrane protein
MEPGKYHEDAEVLAKDWLLRRNCSATPRQFVGFYLAIAVFSLGLAVTIALTGAWMVLIFSGLEVIAVGVAFVIYARHAVDYERIQLRPHRLLIETRSAELVTQHELNPRWVRVEAGSVVNGKWGRESEPITLHVSGKKIEIGQHLALERRAQFAAELRIWLRRCS